MDSNGSMLVRYSIVATSGRLGMSESGCNDVLEGEGGE